MVICKIGTDDRVNQCEDVKQIKIAVYDKTAILDYIAGIKLTVGM